MKKDRIGELFIFEPHNMLISGITCGGKTHFILDLLETVYKDYFENIVLFCTTFDFNETYNRKWIFKDKNVYILEPNLVKTELNKLLFVCEEIFKGSNTLFILDDCANLEDSKRKKTELCNLAYSGRHYGISTWVLVQKYNSVVKDFRENMRMVVIFYNKDENAMAQAFEENAIIPRELRSIINEKLKKNKRVKLVLRLEYPHNFMLIS